MDVFGFQEAVQTFLAEFTGIAAHFKATEGAAVVVGQGVVDPDGTGLYLLEKAFDQAGIIGAEASTQAKVAVVAQGNGLVKGVVGHNGDGRTKGLGPHTDHRVIDIDHHRGAKIPTTFKGIG